MVQGRKRVTLGADSFTFGVGESLLITSDVPTVSQITEASPAVRLLRLLDHPQAASVLAAPAGARCRSTNSRPRPP